MNEDFSNDQVFKITYLDVSNDDVVYPYPKSIIVSNSNQNLAIADAKEKVCVDNVNNIRVQKIENITLAYSNNIIPNGFNKRSVMISAILIILAIIKFFNIIMGGK